MPALLSFAFEKTKPHGSIISIGISKQAQSRMIVPVFWGISG